MRNELTVGRIARAAGVTAGTVRYYERLGLLPRAPRTAGGYRVFPPQALRRLSVVRAAKRFGFSLREIAGFLSIRDAGGKPCDGVRDAGRRMLTKLDGEIADLRVRQQRLRRTLREWDRILAANPGNRLVFLLESLTSSQTG